MRMGETGLQLKGIRPGAYHEARHLLRLFVGSSRGRAFRGTGTSLSAGAHLHVTFLSKVGLCSPPSAVSLL